MAVMRLTRQLPMLRGLLGPSANGRAERGGGRALRVGRSLGQNVLGVGYLFPCSPWLAAATLAVAVAAQSAFGQSNAIENLIEPPGSKVAGRTIGEWTGVWWTWLLTSPLHRDPAQDDSGAHCGIGQDGPVWFLAGSFNEFPVTRRCNVPEGKYILLPMFTGITRPTPDQAQATCKTSQDKSERFADAVIGVYASLDGVPVPSPEKYRERTKDCFDPHGTGRAISAQDGHWIMLRPLSPGKHILRYGRDEKGGKTNTDVSVVLQVGKTASPAVVELEPNEAAPFPRRRPGSTRTTHEEFPAYSPAVFRARPGFGPGDFNRRLMALILREGKYQLVSYNRQAMGSISEVRFTWPDAKERYAAFEDLKLRLPHPVGIPTYRMEDGRYRIDISGVDPNPGPSFALRAEILTDAARLVTEALDRRAPVTDEEALRALRHKPRDFAELVGGDIQAEVVARMQRQSQSQLDLAYASRPMKEEDKLQFTTGDFSAAGGELHAIGVYKGPERSGKPPPPSRITVYVLGFTGRPVVLLLTAYEPVEWRISSMGASISKIIALGHHRQTILGAPAGAMRVSRSFEDGYKEYFFSHGKDAEDLKKFYERAAALTGQLPVTFQGRYAASEFFVDGDAPVRIEGKRGEAPLRPKPQALRAPGDIHFVPSRHVGTYVSPDGLSLSSCLQGGASAVKVNRGHVRGRVYFEMTLNRRASGFYPGTNVGMVPMNDEAVYLDSPEGHSPRGGVGLLQWGEASRYRDGDVFGLAVDLDARQLYFHLNGDWRGKPPGSKGAPLAAGKAYVAAASVSAASNTSTTECSGWTANFGKTPFKYALPQGYMSYDGSAEGGVANEEMEGKGRRPSKRVARP